MKTNKSTRYFLLLFIFLLLVKTDYRLEPGIFCCKDDHDYFAHAETLIIDFDFDYSNQFSGNEKARFYYEGKSAPSTFIGAGLLSTPFVFIGNLLDENIPNNDLFNFTIMLYSFSSIFYLFLTLLLINKINLLLNSKYNSYYLYLFLIGSGVGFYAFERYSMSHVYEVFAITLLIYNCLKYYKKENNFIAFAIPLLIMLALMTRWVNIYVLFLPLIVGKLTKNKINFLSKNKYFWISSFLSTNIFLLHTYLIFGVVTLNPEFTYNTSGTISRYLDSSDGIGTFIWLNLKNLFLVFFGLEFGLFWFSPIIFMGIYIILKNFILSYQKSKFITFLVILSFLQVLGLVLIWKSTGSSYGFRYVMNLAPLSIFILLTNRNLNKFEFIYLKYMSIFAALSVIYFETTPRTQLSTEYIVNMFGKETKFSRPDYLYGYVNSIIEFDSYLKIFSQSFFGFLIFYIFVYFLGKEPFYDLLSKFSLPYDNPDFQLLIEKIIDIEPLKIIIAMLFVIYMPFLLIKNTSKTPIRS
ncbi:MAG: hypothetical protein CMF94_05560 [Candidatus Marinimicrobia bacterium]|nr:hypothetical protein [Candidatus Neomarinimicrobiota bacterium]